VFAAWSMAAAIDVIVANGMSGYGHRRRNP
jgi:hypothetical protein